jgi:hypothetical protein
MPSISLRGNLGGTLNFRRGPVYKDLGVVLYIVFGLSWWAFGPTMLYDTVTTSCVQRRSWVVVALNVVTRIVENEYDSRDN